MENIIILGTGCAGLTAGIYTARANLNPLILEGKQPGGQLTTTSDVENFPGFPEGVDGYTLMDQLRKQATRFGAKIENSFIEKVDLSGEIKTLVAGEKKFEARAVIIATGAAPSTSQHSRRKRNVWRKKGHYLCNLRWSFLQRYGCCGGWWRRFGLRRSSFSDKILFESNPYT